MATSFSFSDGQSLVVVEAVSDAEVRRFNECLTAEHDQGPRPPTDNTLRQVVTRSGEWVALLMRNAAARRLKPREAWIGRDAAKRSSRLKLAVQNIRFLVLSAHRQPNLASAALGAICVRPDLAGVTSLVRWLGLKASGYGSLLRLFHSTGFDA